MRTERMDGIDSKNRNLSVEENLKRFKEMTEGTTFVSHLATSFFFLKFLGFIIDYLQSIF